MPNWSYTYLQVFGDEENIKRLNAGLKNATSVSHNLYDIFVYYGIEKKGYMGRGRIEWFEALGERMDISLETAWGPMLKGLREVISYYIPNAKIIFTEDSESYITNDPDLVGSYCVDIAGTDSKYDGEIYTFTQDEFKEVLEEILGHQGNFDNLLMEFELKFPDSFWNKFEYFDIDDLD